VQCGARVLAIESRWCRLVLNALGPDRMPGESVLPLATLSR